CRREIDDADHLVNALRAFKAWTMNEQWNARGCVVHAALVLLVAGHEVASMVGEKDEDGVVGEVLLFKDLAHAADGGIDRRACAVVVGKLLLPVAGLVAQVVGNVGVFVSVR